MDMKKEVIRERFTRKMDPLLLQPVPEKMHQLVNLVCLLRISESRRNYDDDTGFK